MTLGRIKLNLSFSLPKTEKGKLELWTIWWRQNQAILKSNISRLWGGEGGAMALKVINKINGRLKFLYRKNRYLTPYLKRLLCDALIQPHFNYVCSARYPSLNKRFKSKLQTVQNRCIRYGLQLDNRSHIEKKRLWKN